MKKRTGKAISSKFFKTFWVMLLIFTLVIPSMNGTKIQVHAAGDQEVWKIYATIADDGSESDIQLVSGSESVTGKGLIGKFIKGGSYTLSDEDRDIVIIADNAEITAGNIDLGYNFKLSGESKLIYNDYTLSSTEDRFSSYPASAGAITVDGLSAHYDAEGTPYYSDPSKEIWSRSYDLTVTGEMHLRGEENHDAEDNTWFDPIWMGYNDIKVTSSGRFIIDDGAHLIAENSLEVLQGGSVAGSGNDAYLRVCSGAAITGLPLYAETPDNDVSNTFSTRNHEEYEFRYNQGTSKWIYPFDLNFPVFEFSIGGIDLGGTERISVHYKYSENDNYIVADPIVTYDDGLTASFGISLKNMTDDAKPFSLKIEFFPSENSTKTMLCWRDSRDPVDPIYDGIAGNVFELALTLDKYVEISLGYPNSGNPAIVGTVDDYLYAYSGEEDAIKSYLATELYNRFISVPMYEDFGLKNAGDLKSRITKADTTDPINATAKDGTSVPVSVTNYKVAWGNDIENGDPVVSNIPVYTLPDKDSFLICTDFNKDNGTGKTFYIRKAHADEVPFDGDQDSAISVIIPSINPETIVAGGMGSDTAVHNSDHVYSFSFNSRWLNSNINGPSSDTDPANYGTLIRIMSETETYIWLKGEGETKQYGNIGSSFYG
ncbi:MAG: hypothetical protein K6E95_04060, partial [Lachnospiraceae bacterium]|nr:hypothetical protein [Lachnospiraceae bacterium]